MLWIMFNPFFPFLTQVCYLSILFLMLLSLTIFLFIFPSASNLPLLIILKVSFIIMPPYYHIIPLPLIFFKLGILTLGPSPFLGRLSGGMTPSLVLWGFLTFMGDCWPLIAKDHMWPLLKFFVWPLKLLRWICLTHISKISLPTSVTKSRL